MSDIVHSRTEHVDKKTRPLRANIMSCRRRSMVGEVPPPPAFPDCIPEEDNYSEGIQREHTTPIYPLRSFALT